MWPFFCLHAWNFSNLFQKHTMVNRNSNWILLFILPTERSPSIYYYGNPVTPSVHVYLSNYLAGLMKFSIIYLLHCYGSYSLTEVIFRFLLHSESLFCLSLLCLSVSLKCFFSVAKRHLFCIYNSQYSAGLDKLQYLLQTGSNRIEKQGFLITVCRVEKEICCFCFVSSFFPISGYTF